MSCPTMRAGRLLFERADAERDALVLFTLARRQGFPPAALDSLQHAETPLARLLVLCALPLESGWRALCQELDTLAAGATLDPVLLDALDAALAHWPDTLRTPPAECAARIREGDPLVALPLVRHAELGEALWPLLEHPALRGLRTLVIRWGPVDRDWLARLSRTAFAPRLESLTLQGVWRRAGEATAASRRQRALPRLRSVALWDVSLRLLADVLDHLEPERLEQLELSSWNWHKLALSSRDWQRRALCARLADAAPRLRKVRVDVQKLPICAESLFQLDLAGFSPVRDTLDLSRGRASNATLASLPRMQSVQRARTLVLEHGQISELGLRGLLGGAPMPWLEALRLAHNRLGNRALEHLAERLPTQLPALRLLDLRHNTLGVRALETLLCAPAFQQLERIAIGPPDTLTREVRARWRVLRRVSSLRRRARELDLLDVLEAATPPRAR